MKMRFDKQEQGFYNQYSQGLLQTEPTKPKIKLTSWCFYVLLLAICSPLIFFLFKFGVYLFTVHVTGYVTLPQIEIRASEEGNVAKMSVKLGQHIVAGQPLCQLDQAELKKKANLLQSELDYLLNNPASKGLNTVKQTNLDFAVAQKNYMKKRVDEVTLLFNRGAATEAEMKVAKFQYEEALNRLDDLKASMSRAKDVTLQMQSSLKNHEELRIKELALEKEKLELRAKALSVVAPVAGSIAEIFVAEGHYVSRGDLIFTVTKNEKMHISVHLAPEHIKYTHVGQTANVVFADGEKATAKIVKTSNLEKSTPSNTLISNQDTTAKLEFTQPIKQKLMNGLPVEVFF
jgi:multidrug resistance efflux pump